MDWLDALILGVVQGLTEFLPVSSSGHLQIGQRLLGLNPEMGGLTFSIAVHVATVLSTLVVLWKEVSWIFKGLFEPLKPAGAPPAHSLWNRFNDQQLYAIKILISMIPIGFVGLVMKDWVEAAFNGVHVVGVCLLVTACLLALTFYIRPREKKEISTFDAFIIGLAQAVAVLPGLSRSGSTIATGLLLGNSRQNMAQFSFLMVIPPIIGEALLDFNHIVSPSAEYLAQDGALGAVDPTALIVGFLAAFISGVIACRWMIALVKRLKLIYFAIYCAIMGVLALTLF